MKNLSFHLTQNDVSDIKKVDYGSLEILHAIYEQTSDHLVYPVFFHSVVEMIGMGNFYWAVIYNCLVVFRVSKMYGNYSCIVYFLPISLSNEIQDERVVVGALLEAGFSIRLTENEMSRIGLDLKAVHGHKDTFYNEFIYSIDGSLDMTGHDYSGLRNMVKRFIKEGGRVSYAYTQGVSDFILSWAKMKGIRYKRYVDFLRQTDSDDIYFTSIFLDVKLQGFSAIERVGKSFNTVVFVPNHEAPFDVVPALHYFSLKGLPDKDRGSLVTSGAGCVGGLDVQKRRLRPLIEEVVYRIPAIGPVVNSYNLVKEFL